MAGTAIAVACDDETKSHHFTWARERSDAAIWGTTRLLAMLYNRLRDEQS
jgi:hypothetical protein